MELHSQQPVLWGLREILQNNLALVAEQLERTTGFVKDLQ